MRRFNFNHHHSLKSECELGKIDEEDECDDDDTNDDDISNKENKNDRKDKNNNNNNNIIDEISNHIDLNSSNISEYDWIDWSDALLDQSRHRVWLLSGLHLVCELCRGNFRAQKKSAHFLPPELLLFLIQSESLSLENRFVDSNYFLSFNFLNVLYIIFSIYV